ncbi:hypothetical protein M5K25_017358 [Dendrobium thyrsiflorum]|uniref:Transcription factor n=1 Tax=Dendrobium thyrsiflorum TaxID=117978 RepID=A0ABD0UTZ4_DENTH
MDKASLLADAVSYIKDLRAKVEELEAEAKRARKEPPPARLMAALRDLDLFVHHATVSSLKEMVIQDVVVQVPDALQGEDNLRCALLARLEKN